MLHTLNAFLQKWMPLVTPISVIIGVVLSPIFLPFTSWAPWIFALLTFTGSLSLNFKDLKQVARRPLPVLLALAIIHILMPLIGWSAVTLIFPDEPYTITGILILMLIPAGVVSFMWSSIYKGNLAQTLSVLLLSTLLAPLSVPFGLSFFVGTTVSIDVWAMMKGLLIMIVAPSLIGMAINQLSQGRLPARWNPVLAPLSKVCLSLVVIINGAAVAPMLLQFRAGVLPIALTVVALATGGYLLGWLLAKLLRFDQGEQVALTYCCGMRNMSAGAVIAIAYFPEQVAFPVIIGILVQQTLASTFGKLLFARRLAALEHTA